jgi:hypothetical protein
MNVTIAYDYTLGAYSTINLTESMTIIKDSIMVTTQRLYQYNRKVVSYHSVGR